MNHVAHPDLLHGHPAPPVVRAIATPPVRHQPHGQPAMSFGAVSKTASPAAAQPASPAASLAAALPTLTPGGIAWGGVIPTEPANTLSQSITSALYSITATKSDTAAAKAGNLTGTQKSVAAITATNANNAAVDAKNAQKNKDAAITTAIGAGVLLLLKFL